jgi:hypothetical protein
MNKLFLLYLLSGNILAQEKLEKLILQLGDPDFDIREQASDELKQLPANYAAILAEDTKKHKETPEIEHRLWYIIKHIWENQILPKDERYLEIIGEIGFSWKEILKYEEQEQLPDGAETYCCGPKTIGLVVTAVYPLDCAEGILNDYDIIISIDGKPPELHNEKIIANKKYELVIHRYTDTKYVEENNKPKDNDTFKELKLSVTASQYEWFNDSRHARLNRLKDSGWYEFYNKLIEALATKRDTK